MLKYHQGFTLIEVLVALTVIAISLAALLHSNTQMIRHAEQLKEKTLSHIVQTQAVSMIQLGLLPLNVLQTASETTVFLGKRFYWRATLEKTSIPSLDKITILISPNSNGPFKNPYIAYQNSAFLHTMPWHQR